MRRTDSIAQPVVVQVVDSRPPQVVVVPTRLGAATQLAKVQHLLVIAIGQWTTSIAASASGVATATAASTSTAATAASAAQVIKVYKVGESLLLRRGIAVAEREDLELTVKRGIQTVVRGIELLLLLLWHLLLLLLLLLVADRTGRRTRVQIRGRDAAQEAGRGARTRRIRWLAVIGGIVRPQRRQGIEGARSRGRLRCGQIGEGQVWRAARLLLLLLLLRVAGGRGLLLVIWRPRTRSTSSSTRWTKRTRRLISFPPMIVRRHDRR